MREDEEAYLRDVEEEQGTTRALAIVSFTSVKVVHAYPIGMHINFTPP
jgi:hypothetical protein